MCFRNTIHPTTTRVRERGRRGRVRNSRLTIVSIAHGTRVQYIIMITVAFPHDLPTTSPREKDELLLLILPVHNVVTLDADSFDKTFFRAHRDGVLCTALCDLTDRSAFRARRNRYVSARSLYYTFVRRHA